jgi:anti-anti-sigma factor
MKFDREDLDNLTVVRVNEKKLTSAEAPEMKTALLGLILDSRKPILINLSNVEYTDSTGLGSFLFGIRQAEQHGIEIFLCELKPKVQFLIRIAHLEDVITFFKTEKEALKELD